MSFQQAGQAPHILTIPQFVKSKSAVGLTKEMLRNNTELRGYVRYFDIQFCSTDKFWYAWFTIDIEQQLLKSGK